MVVHVDKAIMGAWQILMYNLALYPIDALLVN